MKWLDDKIRKSVLDNISIYGEGLDRHCTELEYIKRNVSELNKEVQDIAKEVRSELIKIQESQNLDIRRMNLRIDEKDKILREEIDSSLTGLIRNLDKKLILLGDKKGVVVDLLKRIAQLEGEINVPV